MARRLRQRGRRRTRARALVTPIILIGATPPPAQDRVVAEGLSVGPTGRRSPPRQEDRPPQACRSDRFVAQAITPAPRTWRALPRPPTRELGSRRTSASSPTQSREARRRAGE